MKTPDTANGYEHVPEQEIVYDAEYAVVGNQNPPATPNEDDLTGTGRQIGGAAVAGGIAGLLLAGPVIALAAAGGAAVLATTKSGAGNVMRGCGDAMADAGDRLKKIDKKHSVVQKTTKGVTKGCKWVNRQMNGGDKRSREADLVA